MTKHAIWNKLVWAMMLLGMFLQACTQAKNTPVAENGGIVMPMNRPTEISAEQMTQLSKRILSEPLNAQELRGLSMNQRDVLLQIIQRANPKATLDVDASIGALWEGKAAIAPSFDGLNQVHQHNAQLLYAAMKENIEHLAKIHRQIDTQRLTSADVENTSGEELFLLIRSYIGKHPDQRSAMRKMERLPNETEQAFADRQFSVFDDTVAYNLRLLNRYVTYYQERGWWRFTR